MMRYRWTVLRLPGRPGVRGFAMDEAGRSAFVARSFRGWTWQATIPMGGSDFRWPFEGTEPTLREALYEAEACHPGYPPFDRPYDPPKPVEPEPAGPQGGELVS